MNMPAQESNTITEKSISYTTKFGEVTLREDRLISFPNGILGFTDCTVFGLSRMPNSDDSPLMLLQCVNEPEISFMVGDPDILGLIIKPEDKKQALRATAMDESKTQFLVVLTIYEQENSYFITANLRAPLMIDSNTREGRQYILLNKEYTTQHKL